MNTIRSFRRDDIPAVVDLRKRCFRRAGHEDVAGMAAHFERIFFDNPWYRGDFPSLLCVDGDGRAVGFLGVLARPLRMGHRQLWMAVFSQLMVDPDSRGEGHGYELLHTFLAGPQDISVAELATDNTRRIWERLGGKTSILQSLFWSRPLLPIQDMSSGLAKRLGWAGTAINLAAAGVDALILAAASDQPKTELESVPIKSSAELLVCLRKFADHETPWPDYDESGLEWILALLEDGLVGHKQRMANVFDATGEQLGWYIYNLTPSRHCEVVQLGGIPDQISAVITALVRDARRDRAVRLSGRVHGEYLAGLTSPSTHIVSRPPWVLVDAKKKDILVEFLTGQFYFSRLDGEWCLGF